MLGLMAVGAEDFFFVFGRKLNAARDQLRSNAIGGFTFAAYFPALLADADSVLPALLSAFG